MASPVRASTCLNRRSQPKERYPSRCEAVIAKREKGLDDDPRLQPYLCPDCADWHLGHGPVSKKPPRYFKERVTSVLCLCGTC